LLLASSLCGAQTVVAGTFQASGVTSLVLNRQTISTSGTTGRLQSGDVGMTSANLGLEGTYYIAPHVGIGALATYQRLSADVAGSDVRFEVSGGFFGPMAQVRLPLGNRSEFVFIGSGGGVKTRLVNQNTGILNNVSSSLDGRYWLAGGGLSFPVVSNASVDLGVRYQSSTFSGRTSADGHVTAAGLLAQMAFSLYFR
jgi:opacity protein-like surface antigen